METVVGIRLRSGTDVFRERTSDDRQHDAPEPEICVAPLRADARDICLRWRGVAATDVAHECQ
ncbi:hypothetical protein AB0C41_33115, partial [Micromonospora taraxaci]|uniref:hypothetical protein n=1 Tax=Micromonospora taraxaci TaxID=1316803 RepID=UPI0033F92D38